MKRQEMLELCIAIWLKKDYAKPEDADEARSEFEDMSDHELEIYIRGNN